MDESAVGLDGGEDLDGARPVAWSPCGEELVVRPFYGKSSLVGVSGGRTRTLAQTGDHLTQVRGDIGHSWSSDGRWLAGGGRLYSPYGSGAECLFPAALYVCDVGEIDEIEGDDCELLLQGEFRGGARWSIDSSRIAAVRRPIFCTDVEGEVGMGSWSVDVVDVEGEVVSFSRGEVRAAAWSPRARHLVVAVDDASGPALLVWDPQRDELLAEHPAPLVDQVEWFGDPDRWVVVTADDTPAIVTLDPETGERLGEWPGYESAVFSPDGERAVAVRADGDVEVVLDLVTGETRPAVGYAHEWRRRCD